MHARVQPLDASDEATSASCKAGGSDRRTDLFSCPASALTEEQLTTLINCINDGVWWRYCKLQVRQNYRSNKGSAGAQCGIKDRYLADCQVWGVAAALFATIGVSFLLLGPTNYRDAQYPDEEAVMEVVTYLYTALSVGVIVLNAAAVFMAAHTWCLSNLVPDENFLQWLALKGHNWHSRDPLADKLGSGWYRWPYHLRPGLHNPSWWVARGMWCLAGCIAAAVYLLQGPWHTVVAGGCFGLLWYLLHVATSRVFASFLTVMAGHL